MRVSIGILAWNEEKVIARTMLSLFRQSIFTSDKDDLDVNFWEVIVVPNGCTDTTAETAKKALRQCCEQSHKSEIIHWKVIKIEQAGKSNAWNYYIHDFSDKLVDFIIMIDADIEFDHIDTIYNSLKEFKKNSKADVVVDTPLKHFSKKKNKTLIEKISTMKSNQTLQGDPAIAGSFYCAKAEILRQIWMPIELTGEDGFLRAMIITDLFRSEPDPSKISRASNASHFYEGLVTFRAIFRHELRMIIGTTFNCYFCWDFLLFATDPTGPGAGYLIKSRLELDPEWYKKFITNEIENRGFWVLPRGILLGDIIRTKNVIPNQIPRFLLIAMVRLLLDLPLMMIANYKIKRGSIGYW